MKFFSYVVHMFLSLLGVLGVAGVAWAQSVSSISLVQAANSQTISSVSNGSTINLSSLPTANLSMTAATSPSTVGSVKFVLVTNGSTYTHTENMYPYTLCGKANPGDYACPQLNSVGTHTLTVTPYPGVNASGTPGKGSTITFNVEQSTSVTGTSSGKGVVSFSLVAASSGTPISGYNPISSGATINLSTLSTQNLSIVANTSPSTVGSVTFSLSTNGSTYTHTENMAPYTLCGKANPGDFACSQLDISGSQKLTATAYSGSTGTGTTVGSFQVSFSSTDSSTGGSSGSGGGTTGSPAAGFLAFAATLKSSGKLLVGQHTQYYEGNTNDETEAFTSITPLYSTTGKLPAIIGVTANWNGTNDPYNQSGGGQPDLTVVKQIITDWNSASSNSYKPEAGSGIIQINWGSADPTGTSVNLSPISSGALTELVTPGSHYYNTWKTSTRELQTWLLSVVAANPNAVLLVRLFAELNGYYWYGTQNSQTDVKNQITLQQQTFNTLFSGAGASLRKNVLIVYDANNYGGFGPAAAWPTKSYADLAGWDMYSSSWNPPALYPDTYDAFVAFDVPLILCEVGITKSNLPAPPDYTVDNTIIPNFLRKNERAVIGYVQWDDNGHGAQGESMSITKQNNAMEVMTDPSTVTLTDLPKF